MIGGRTRRYSGRQIAAADLWALCDEVTRRKLGGKSHYPIDKHQKGVLGMQSATKILVVGMVLCFSSSASSLGAEESSPDRADVEHTATTLLSESGKTRICACKGKGGLTGVLFWGPEGSYCNSHPSWGVYDQYCVSADVPICACRGRGAVDQLGLWGPRDEPCGGESSWGKYYAECVDRSERRICSCEGRGGLAANALWGPEDKWCGGHAGWGNYTDDCRD